MNIKSIIFSVFSSDVSIHVNIDRTEYVTASLELDGVNFQLADGVYKGNRETSIIVIDTPKNRALVLGFASLFCQESVLIIDENQNGELVTSAGDYLLTVGRIRCVSERVAKSRDAYTKVGNAFYVGDEIAHDKRNAYLPGSGSVACADWDSLKPQALTDKDTGQALGVLVARAVPEALGPGIQSWSRPQNGDSRV